jgi:uncharacterized RDD family membrane protein YckC
MSGYPPPPGSVPQPPSGGFPPGPPPASPGWSAPPAPPPAGAPGPFGAPEGYAPPGAQGYWGAPAFAGWWSRFAAAILDGIVTGLFGLPAFVALRTGSTRLTSCSVDESGDITGFGDNANGLCEVPTNTTWVIFGVLAAAALIGAIVYYATLEGGSGQTVGKRALGIRVVDSRTGGSIGTGRGVGRYFARIVSALPCYLGYLWAAWDPKKQAFHDKIVNTLVVKV